MITEPSPGHQSLHFFETPKCFAIYLWTHTSFLIYRIQLHVILCYLLDYSENIRIFAAENKKITIMTAIELNAQIWRDMAEIADSEPLMKQLAKYLKRLVAKKTDQTLMTKEEFFAKLEEAEQQMERGEYSVMLPDEDLTTHLKRLGYDI